MVTNALFDPQKRLAKMNLRPQDIPDHLWELESISQDGLRKTYLYFDINSGLTFRKTTTEQSVEDDLMKLIAEERAENETKKWGDGMIGARVPINRYFKEIAPYRTSGDLEHIKWWMNRDENQLFRTKRGRL